MILWDVLVAVEDIAAAVAEVIAVAEDSEADFLAVVGVAEDLVAEVDIVVAGTVEAIIAAVADTMAADTMAGAEAVE